MAKEIDLSAIRSKVYKPKIQDYKLKMLIYGDPGVGKTTLAATANHHPLTKDVFFINLNSGMLSVAEKNSIIKEIPDTVDIQKYSELEDYFWFLAKGEHNYNTVVIDTLTELQELGLEEIVKGKLKERTRSGKKRKDIDDRWQEDYGESTSKLTRLSRSFRDLPLHVIFICHKRKDEDEDTDVERIGPALSPKLQTNVAGHMDIVAYMFKGQAEDAGDKESKLVHKALFQPYGKFIAKDRTPGGKLGLFMDNPTVPKMLNKILGGDK